MRFTLRAAMATLPLLCGLTLSDRLLAAPPGQGMQESFPGCTWGEVKGRDASIWSFDCPDKSTGQHLIADDTVPGFVLKQADPANGKDRVVIRFFAKAAGAAVPSVLTAVRKASPGKYTARCALVLQPAREDTKAKLYALEPTGPEAKAWDASQKTSKMPDEPCGPLGTAYVGDRFFQEMAGDPTRVVFIDMGSDLQIFDPSTLGSVAR